MNYYVYFLTDDHGHIKIGKAVNVWARKQELQTGNPYRLRILLMVPTNTEKEAYELETILHKQFADYRLEGEWFVEQPVLDMLEGNWINVGRFKFCGRGIPLERYIR